MSGFSFLKYNFPCTTTHSGCLKIMKKGFLSTCLAFKISMLAHDIRKNTVIFIVISRF